ncbi:MAG: MBL fold metallo-hydrolase [Prevotellaceae bacterium]|nr:MBL fold metallo-hydrolase [Prevotellaceae bacterium]
MTVTFLGTGTSQGVPVIGCQCVACQSSNMKDKRLRTSALIEISGNRILIDAGPDFRQQLLRANISKIDAILLTHEHKDHIGGLDDIRALNYISGKPVDIYAEARVLNALRLEYAYAFAENPYPGVPEMNLHEISAESNFFINNICITPIRVMHHKLPVLGFKIASLVYITDANKIDGQEFQKIKGCDTLIINALRKKEHLSHFSLSQALKIADMSGAKNTFLTHISHQMGLHDEIENDLPENVKLAYDELEFRV